MIILESDWNEAAGLDIPEADRTENADRNALPSYVEAAANQTNSRASSGTSSLPSLRSSQNQSSVLIEPPPSASSTNGTVPSERLPNYRDSSDSARTGPVTYMFSHVDNSYNSMSLRSQTAMIPLYHVAVRLNCFIPSSYITVISRGDEYGEQVGQFEMGLSVRKGTVTIDGRERLIDAVLTKGGNRLTRNWQWRFDGDPAKHLTWMFDGPVKQCYQGTKNVGALLASFTPPPLTPLPNGRPSPSASLKMYPEGHKAFDHILISALILERRSLLPRSRHNILSSPSYVSRTSYREKIPRIIFGANSVDNADARMRCQSPEGMMECLYTTMTHLFESLSLVYIFYAISSVSSRAYFRIMQTYIVNAKEPTVLAGRSHYRLRNNDLHLAFKIDTAHIVPGPIDIARFNSALSETLSVYPLYAGRIQRGHDKEPWQVRLTNQGVPTAIIDTDAEKEVPHNCIVQSPWTLSQGIDPRKQWDDESDEPLLRVTITRFTKLGSTSVGLSAAHAVGDGFTILRFVRLLSQNYQGLETLDEAPSYADIPAYPYDVNDINKIQEMPMLSFRNMFPVRDTPPFLQSDGTKALRVDLHFTAEQVAQIKAAVKSLAPDPEEAHRISRQDALWALLVYSMSKVDPECFAQHLGTLINSRGIEPRPSTAMNNSLIWALTDPVADPSSETIYSIALRVRKSVDLIRQPAFAAAFDAVQDPVALETANADLSQNFVQPPGDWILNSTWRFEWTSAHFGYKGRTRFFHTQLAKPRFAKMFQPNPEVMPDGTVKPSPYAVEVTFFLYEEARARFKPALLEEMRRLGVHSGPDFVDLI